MTLDTFFTTQIVQPGNTTKVAASGTAPGITGAQDFLNLLVSRLNETTTAQNAATQAKQNTVAAAAADASSKENTNALDIIKILADTDEISEQAAQDGENFSLDLLTQIANVMSLNQQAIKAQLDSNPELVKALPIDQQPNTIQDMLKSIFQQDGNAAASLKQVLDKLQKLAAEGNPLVITANLTPDQITTLQKLVAPAQLDVTADTSLSTKTADVDTLSENKNDEAVAALMFGLVSLLPPEQRPQMIVLPRAVVTADNKVSVDGATTSKPVNDMAATLNSLIAPGEGYGEAPIEGSTEFQNLIEQMSGNKGKAGNTNGNAEGIGNIKTPTANPDLSTLQNWQFNVADTTLGAWGTDAASFESLYGATSSLHGTSLSTLTNPVTQAQNAGQSIGPSQMVALTMQKQAAGSENKQFKLQLDPPELGRVEVRMEFAKDKSVKAHMIVEKPETLAMLQRDGHNLERALLVDNIGAGGDASISFELASQDHDFQNNGGHEGNNSSGGGNDTDIDADTIIETTMSWHVDPETGHTRYRLLV